MVIIRASLLFALGALPLTAAADNPVGAEFDALSPYELAQGQKVPGDCTNPDTFLIWGDTGNRYCFSSPDALQATVADIHEIMDQAAANYRRLGGR